MEYKGTLKTVEEFNEIVLRTRDGGHLLHLSDVAEVEIGAVSYNFTSNIDGQPGTIYMVFQAPGANATEVNARINKLYEELKPTMPAGLEFEILETSDDFLFAAIHNVVETLVIAIILVILVVYFFLQSFKATVIPSLSIIVSLLGTFAIVKLAGFSLNILTLFALVLAIGTVVDDAIVVVEAVMAKIESGITDARRATREAMSDVSWREFFTDPLLQRLIDTALVRNTDINSARIAIQQSEASLAAAKQAFFPSVAFAPSETVGSFGGSKASWTYNLPLQVDWDIDAFGSIKSKKRKSEAVLKQAQIAEQAVRANIISAVAQQYSTLLLLDQQLEILMATDSLWNISLETQKILWENGKSYSTAVNQMESSYLNVKTSIVDTRNNIRQMENSLCRLLAITPQHIERSHLGIYALPRRFSTGVPALLLQNRPDIKLADLAMEEAFYNTQTARAAFFPSISLQGLAGWTNSAGAGVVNPGKILLNAVASLTQPIYAQGKLKANLKINQLTQQDLMNQYVQTVIDAGSEVNDALADCQASVEKHSFYHRQVAVLKEVYRGTHELMDNGKASYLEVLTAQETLLNAQLNEATNMYNGAMGIIALYIALGGATH